jgi:hypothetical protein
MLFHAGGLETAEGRHHPWTVSAENPEFKYYDFRKHPELIPRVLEDFRPFDQYDATQRFYEMVTWLNGDESKFETSDCRFDGIKPNTQKDKWNKELACHGALVVLFRNLKYNLSEDSRAWSNQKIMTGVTPPRQYQPSKYLKWMADQSEHLVRQINPGFRLGCIATSFYNVYYVDGAEDNRDKFGYQLVYRFWAWGDTDDEIMSNLKIVFDALTMCLKKLSTDVPE